MAAKDCGFESHQGRFFLILFISFFIFYQTCSQQEPNFISNTVESIIKCKSFKNNNTDYSRYRKYSLVEKKL